MTTETTGTETRRRSGAVKLQKYIILGVPIIIVLGILLKAAGPALWASVKTMVIALFPNIWVILAYVYIALVAYTIGESRWK